MDHVPGREDLIMLRFQFPQIKLYKSNAISIQNLPGLFFFIFFFLSVSRRKRTMNGKM